MAKVTRLEKAFSVYSPHVIKKLGEGFKSLAVTFRYYSGSIISGNFETLLGTPRTRKTFNAVAGGMMAVSLLTVLGTGVPALLATTALSTAYYFAVRRQLQRAAEGKNPDDTILSINGRAFSNRHLNKILGAGFAFATFVTAGTYVLAGLNAAVHTVTSPLVNIPVIEYLVHVLRLASETLTSATNYLLPLGTAFISAVAGNHFAKILNRNDRFPVSPAIQSGTGWTLSRRAIEIRQAELQRRREKSTFTKQVTEDFRYFALNGIAGATAILAVASLNSDASEILQHVSDHPTAYAQIFAAGFVLFPALRRFANIAVGTAVFAATGYLMGVFDPSPFLDLFVNDNSNILDSAKNIGLSFVNYGYELINSLWNVAPALLGIAAYSFNYGMWRKLGNASYRTGKFFVDTFNSPYRALKDNVFNKEMYIELGNLFLDALSQVSKLFERPIGWLAGMAFALTVYNFTGLSDVGLTDVYNFVTTGDYQTNILFKLDGEDSPLPQLVAMPVKVAGTVAAGYFGGKLSGKYMKSAVNALTGAYYKVTGQTIEAVERREEMARNEGKVPDSMPYGHTPG